MFFTPRAWVFLVAAAAGTAGDSDLDGPFGVAGPRTWGARPGIVFVKLSRVGGSTFGSVCQRLALNYDLRTPGRHHAYDGHAPRLRALAEARKRTGEPYQMWFYHTMYFADEFAALVPSARGRYVSIVREPAQRWLSAWHVMVQPTLERDVKRGWGLGAIGRTPAAYCAALAADPALFVRERRTRKRNAICVDGLAKGLLGLGRVEFPEAEFEARVDGLLATIAAPDSPAFLMVNERYDVSLVAFAREYGLGLADVLYVKQQVSVSRGRATGTDNRVGTAAPGQKRRWTEPPEVMECIRGLHPSDTRIYAAAQTKLEARAAGLGADVAEYKALQKRAAEFCRASPGHRQCRIMRADLTTPRAVAWCAKHPGHHDCRLDAGIR